MGQLFSQLSIFEFFVCKGISVAMYPRQSASIEAELLGLTSIYSEITEIMFFLFNMIMRPSHELSNYVTRAKYNTANENSTAIYETYIRILQCNYTSHARRGIS